MRCRLPTLVVKTGFAPATVSVQVAAGGVQEAFVELQVQRTVAETVTVVASTRTDKRLEDQPMRVEVLAREEIEEKMLVTPGSLIAKRDGWIDAGNLPGRQVARNERDEHEPPSRKQKGDRIGRAEPCKKHRQRRRDEE
jgi:hypothetical protein